MHISRRNFAGLSLAALGALAADAQSPTPPDAPPGAPPTFGDAPGAGPEVGAATFREAAKLMQVELSDAELAQAAGNWRAQMAPLLERRTGPHKVPLEDTLAPATIWHPASAAKIEVRENRFIRTADAHAPLPSSDTEIAYAPVAQLARWIETRKLTSERLTKIYLDRIDRYDAKLHCVITLMRDQALAQARRADAEIAAGHYRGPLHGIPWGAKDLVDTAGVATTYGAEPFRNRVPATNATVVDRLDAAGAVLVAKLSMGALALNDVWFGGQTRNPWLTDEGSSGSSAGPGAATAAGLVAFAMGSETLGSIVSPSMRCGLTGLRPTFGRVPRTGAMTLCWSLDKLGPMARSAEDTMLVLHAIAGVEKNDLASVDEPLAFDASAPVSGLRVGYIPAWMKDAPATDVDRAALEKMRALGITPVEVSLPDWPYDSLVLILMAEAAAAFEELTLTHGVDKLNVQLPDAWPNVFRQSRFLSAVDFVQADRLRRKVAAEMARVLSEVDLLLVPALRDEMLVITNFTGHPTLVVRAGFVEITEPRSDWAPDPAHPPKKLPAPRRMPYGVALVGRLFDEGTVVRAGMALEGALNVAGATPPDFS